MPETMVKTCAARDDRVVATTIRSSRSTTLSGRERKAAERDRGVPVSEPIASPRRKTPPARRGDKADLSNTFAKAFERSA